MSVLKSSRNPNSDPQLFEFTHGVDLDSHLARQEVQVQKAWADALAAIHLISSDDAARSQCFLDEALGLIQEKRFPWRIEDEDIHMNLERFLVEKMGEVGKRLHLGRSRNDLIATTLRLFVRDALLEVQNLLEQLTFTLVAQSETWIDVIIPGMTHLQHGQPIRLGHILAAHGWGFSRDREKIQFAQARAMATLPLGSAALAGTTIPVDLGALAKKLGFQSCLKNSYDSVGDRDFILDALEGFSNIAIHCTRLCEDLIYWSSSTIALFRLPPRWSTGSSIMPNKRNPDVPELVRGKSAQILSAITSAHFLLKGLPSSYHSDLHELKRIFLNAFHTTVQCLKILASFLVEAQVNPHRAQELLKIGNILATEIANELTIQGLPFREAYQQTAALVEKAEIHRVSVEQLFSESQTGESHFQRAGKLSYESAVEARNLPGGTSRNTALAGIAELKRTIQLD
jgi:argininosuccinate lyase